MAATCGFVMLSREGASAPGQVQSGQLTPFPPAVGRRDTRYRLRRGGPVTHGTQHVFPPEGAWRGALTGAHTSVDVTAQNPAPDTQAPRGGSSANGACFGILHKN